MHLNPHKRNEGQEIAHSTGEQGAVPSASPVPVSSLPAGPPDTYPLKLLAALPVSVCICALLRLLLKLQPAVVSARWSGEEDTLSMSSAFYLADMLSQSLYVLTLLPELPTKKSFSADSVASTCIGEIDGSSMCC